jgi:secondary thiamine-phosphate synthase enzyme
MPTLSVDTRSREEFFDLTPQVEALVKDSGIQEGTCHLFCLHTTAGLTVNENYDPDVKRDALAALDRMVPQAAAYRHAEGNSPAHVKAMLLGASLSLPIQAGRLQLGRWQGVFLAEFDGPRRARQVVVTISTAVKDPV